MRYIHLNLLRAGVVRDIEELKRCPWSGHSALMGTIKREWQECGYMLALFSNNKRNRRRDYLKYVEEGIPLGRRPELVGGGLVRSLGGWSEVLALRRRGERAVSDWRILGDSEFVQEVISGLDDLVKKNLRLSGQRMDVAKLAELVCKDNDISVGELCSGSRRHVVVEARRIISWIALRELGYSGADVARYLGVTNSCVTRFVSTGRKPKI